jgi:hypothetical protein
MVGLFSAAIMTVLLAQEPVVKHPRRTETGEAPGDQGARRANIGNIQPTSNAERRDASPVECSGCFTAGSQGTVVDRLVAVVSGQPILQSDLRAARALALVPGAATLDDTALIDRLVVRELMRAEVERFSTTLDMERTASRQPEADARIAKAGGEAGLAALAMSNGRLVAWLEDDARIEQYLRQRFDAAAQPSDDEALTWFQIHERDYLRDGRPRPFAEVRDEVRARLAAERRQTLIDEWVASLRRRATIVLVPLAAPPP